MTLREIASGDVSFGNIDELPDMHQKETDIEETDLENDAKQQDLTFGVKKDNEQRLLRSFSC